MVFKLILPSLIATMAMNFQGMSKTPFETHTVSMWVFIFSAFVYYSAISIIESSSQQQYPYHFNRIAFVFGSPASICLLSTLLTFFPLGLLLFLLWGFFSMLFIFYEWIISAIQSSLLLVRYICDMIWNNIWLKACGDNNNSAGKQEEESAAV